MIAYLDLPSGLSGDMFLGCLVDAGWPVDELKSALDRLHMPAEEYSLSAQPVQRGPIRATLVTVDVIKSMQKRNLSDIRTILDRSDLTDSIRQKAADVFGRLAAAEARVHGEPVDKVHFHEVGAVDAIVDIVGVCAGLEALGVEKLYASGVPLGEGWTRSMHGLIPVPAPATLELLTAAKAPTRSSPGGGELITPTGAALLASLAEFRQPALRLEKLGTGAGQRDCAWPNVARLWLGTDADAATSPLVQIESNIDDMNPQLYAPVMDRLFDAGALDVWLTPVQMKKGRPATVLSVLAPAALETPLAQIILHHTTTLGVRVHAVHRHEAGREIITVQTSFGEVPVKLKRLGDDVIGATPEFDDCRRLADAAGVPVRIVIDAARAAVIRA
jgi:uncharacterized protein (TIGR00299 family) protein